MKFMKLKIPPVVVFLVFGALMYALQKLLPVGYFDFFGRRYLMYGLVVIASSIGLISVLQFIKSKTTVSPVKPDEASKLVTNGLYQFSRNPMYLSMLLLLLALGLYFGNAFNILIAAGFVMYMNKFQIIPEEEVLLNLFGKEYKHYCALTRRWF